MVIQKIVDYFGVVVLAHIKNLLHCQTSGLNAQQKNKVVINIFFLFWHVAEKLHWNSVVGYLSQLFPSLLGGKMSCQWHQLPGKNIPLYFVNLMPQIISTCHHLLFLGKLDSIAHQGHANMLVFGDVFFSVMISEYCTNVPLVIFVIC